MLTDFGGYPPGQSLYTEHIAGLGQLKAVMADCAAAGRPMRARCYGHSMNGMAVPRAGETLIDMSGVRHLASTGRASITVGAGVAVWDADQYVRKSGWKLPVVNDGGAAASSIGGFISAGGIGEGCMLHGGFWETVSSVLLVTAAGEALSVHRSEPLFPWLFGSQGALGVIYEATIDLVPASSARPRSIPDIKVMPDLPRDGWPRHLWLTLFVTEEQREDALTSLGNLAATNPDVWHPRSAYEYFLLHRRFNPPLIFGPGKDFIALGLWGDREDSDIDLQRYLAMEARFQSTIEARGWRRYYQSELIRDRRPLARYVGPACARAFGEMKAIHDPLNLLNRVDLGGIDGGMS
jgi:hypothetical protein